MSATILTLGLAGVDLRADFLPLQRLFFSQGRVSDGRCEPYDFVVGDGVFTIDRRGRKVV